MGGGAIDFVTLQNMVLADGFAESDRRSCREWINFRYAWLFDVDAWTFQQGPAVVSLTAGSQAVTGMPTDFGVVLGLLRADGSPLRAIPQVRNFMATYYGKTGVPESYCVSGSQILVGPTSSITEAGCLLIYEKSVAPLVANSDVPIIPEMYHLALVHGGKAEALKMKNVPLWESFDADFQAAVTAMRRKYLVPMRGELAQAGAFSP